MSTFAEAMSARSIEPLVADVVHEIHGQSPMLPFPTRATRYLAWVPEEGAQIAVYADRRVLAVALSPDRAEQVANALRVQLQRRPGIEPTFYVRATAEQLAQEHVREGMAGAGVEALTWCRDRYKGIGGTPRGARPSADICVVCNYELAPNGDCHSTTCED